VKTTAKFTAKGSDGSVITGTLVATKLSNRLTYDFNASFSVAVPGGTFRDSLPGYRHLNQSLAL
jgi:hypothetical protein